MYSDWIDLPIIEAIDYFQGVFTYFMSFSLKYSRVIGLIGLIWTALKLVNSRSDMRSAWWDTFSKWLVFILLMNFYYAGTNLISLIANETGLEAGSGKQTIISNFVSLRNRIEADLRVEEKWSQGLTDIINAELGVNLEYIEPGTSLDDYVSSVINPTIDNNRYQFSTRKQAKEFNDKVQAYWKSRPDNEKSMWGQQTLNALNSVLIMTTPEGKELDITGAYVTENPELNLWLIDSSGKKTCYFSASAIGRIGLLIASIIQEKANMVVTEIVDADGNTEYEVRNAKFSMKRIGNYIMSWILSLCVIVSVIFAIIQYVMCILEYIIVQAIGSAFIPFYLFDGTKDIPKKLVPVFIGFAVKMLVQIICLMFIINLFLNFAAAQISPTSGNITWASFFEGLFICILAFILTSNAPKIAMTILTGQPQLSMGEFVSAAGAMAGGAMMAKNAAGSITSPAKEAAKKKAHDWNERRAASKEAMGNTKKDLKKNFSYDPNSKLSEKEQKKNYMNEHKGEIKAAGKNASNEVKSQQKANYMAHGGVMGSAGRLMAHYTGVAADLMKPKQRMLGQGRTYHTPGDSIDIHRIAERNQSKDEISKSQEAADTNVNTKKEDSKNEVVSDKPKDPKVGNRSTE